jgi:hypothetical protein
MKIIITIEYDPEMEHYPSGWSVRQAMELEAEGLRNGDVSIDEFIGYIDDLQSDQPISLHRFHVKVEE